jgi:TPR repeat protein
VTKDLNKAKEWYTKAAAQGHEKAQNQLDKKNFSKHSILYSYFNVQISKICEPKKYIQ